MNGRKEKANCFSRPRRKGNLEGSKTAVGGSEPTQLRYENTKANKRKVGINKD